jgi:hypothetical protein
MWFFAHFMPSLTKVSIRKSFILGLELTEVSLFLCRNKTILYSIKVIAYQDKTLHENKKSLYHRMFDQSQQIFRSNRPPR